eukprot:COSAG01_NODE_414_length_17360_cov_226.576907_3_plen_64_part_00
MSTDCASTLEPFWDACADVLSLIGMVLVGMPEFYGTCMLTLYPLGRCCPNTCKDTASFHCTIL